MKDLSKHKQINWVDGMKINKDHFIGQENYFNSRIQGMLFRMTDRYNYGLLPSEHGEEGTIKFIPELENQKLKISLLNCQAITPAGYWIDIADDVPGKNDEGHVGVESFMELDGLEEGEYYLVLNADPYTRAAAGKVSAGEDPLRFPYAVPEYKLRLSNVENGIKGKFDENSVVIGKISYRDNKPEIVTDYIPPCTNILSHPGLQDFYTKLTQSLATLERNIVELISEIHSRQSTNILTSTILYLSDKLLIFLGIHSTQYRWYLKDQPPIALVDWVVTISKTLRNSFDTRTAEEREKLMNYFHDHFDINPSQFKQLMDQTIDIEYEHNDINLSLEKADDFLNFITTLFNELKKMEFIVGGKRKSKKIDILIR